MFVLAIIFAVIFMIVVIVRIAMQFTSDADAREARPYVTGTAFALLFFTGLFTFFSCSVVVNTKEDGILTAFSKPVGVLTNGFHLIAPWESVTEMDAAIQTDNDLDSNKPANCVPTRIAHQIISCVDVTIRWRIVESAAPELFQDYRDFSNV